MAYNNTYPRDYIEWCFGEANNISEYTKAKQLDLMEDNAARIQRGESEYFAHVQARYLREHNDCYADEHEPVPAHQVLTDRLTELLGA